jgi:hypothetical protein
LVVASLGFLFVQYFFDPALYKRIIQDSLSQALGKEVFIGKARIGLWEGVGVTFEDFHIRDRSGSFDLLYSKKVFFKAKLLPLLRKEVEWKRIVLEGPTILGTMTLPEPRKFEKKKPVASSSDELLKGKKKKRKRIKNKPGAETESLTEKESSQKSRQRERRGGFFREIQKPELSRNKTKSGGVRPKLKRTNRLWPNRSASGPPRKVPTVPAARKAKR